MRRKRRPTVNWLPVQGVQPDPNTVDVKINGTTFAIAVLGSPAGGGITTAFLPLTFDNPAQQRFNALEAIAGGNVRPSLKDYIQGSGYRLRRIVGKISAQHRSSPGQPPATSPPGCLFCLAFIVLKVDPETGDPLHSAVINEYSPLLAQNVEDPWIWRRVWHLGSGSQGDGSDTDLLFGFAPDTTRLYGGGNNDGPHIDQKTARKVGPDERLFAVFSTKALALLTNYTNDSLVAGYLDWRLLGSVVNSASSNRGHASR